MGKRIFLNRVLNSLGAAALPGTQWIIVDDSRAGDGAAEEIAKKASKFPNLRPILVASAQRHRARAMNAGLAAADGEFVHILDDDDTVAAEFYSQMIAALEKSPETAAVAARSSMVEETIDAAAGAAAELRRTAHFPEIKSISISMMLVQQVTPTCSLLFRSRPMRETGPFCEDFEVCEDYEFLLRFILRNDIQLLDKHLCAFHVRAGTGKGEYSNSESSWNHAEADGKLRNALLRRSLNNPADQLGYLMLLGDLARGAVKVDRATELLRKSPLWRSVYRLLRKH